MFSLFKKKKPRIVVVTLNARLQPLDRGELEDAFDASMEKRGLAIRVVGGGTQMADNGEVAECDIEIASEESLEVTVDTVTGTLAAMLAPKGSMLNVSDPDRRMAFGDHEGLALYLNGTDLAEEVYRDCDSNFVYSECVRLLEGVGLVSSHWQGPTETALYMYGQNYIAMEQAIAPFIQSYPLCQQSRVVQIA